MTGKQNLQVSKNDPNKHTMQLHSGECKLTVSNASVFVVDDDPLICDSLKLLVTSVGLQADTFSSASSFLDTELPDKSCCLVLDIRMPDMSGLDLQAELIKRKVSMPVIFITGHGTVPMSVRAMKAGAVDFFEKPFEDQMLLDTIQYAIKQHDHIRIEQNAITSIEKRIQLLTSREHEILLLVTAGTLNKHIATRLKMSENTVKTHRARIMRKMEVTSLAELVQATEKADMNTSIKNELQKVE